MKPVVHLASRALAGAIALGCLPAQGAADDADALELKSEPAPTAPSVQRPTRLYVEAALGGIDQRYGLGTQDLQRLSIDLRHTARFSPQWTAVFSDRLDGLSPAEPGKDATLNSLREAYVGWASEDGAQAIELGRINVRHGPAYGYNPTDFFRDGSLRAVTTANPLAWRENRMGSVMLRGQHLWSSGSVSLALSPKLEDTPSGESFNLDLGSTNHVDRGLATLNYQWSDALSGQLLLYKESGQSVQTGLNVSALLSQSVVAFAEWTTSDEPTLAQRSVGLKGNTSRGQRFAGGLTWTTAGKLSLTAEVQTSDFALSSSEFDTLVGTAPALAAAYLSESLRRQDLPVRTAYFLYASQRDLGIKNLDLTAMLRYYAGDHSSLAWLELRHRWASVDLALQMQFNSGDATSVYGLTPDRRTLQLVAAYHFQ